MRYTPAALALALLATVSSSVIYSAPREELSPRAEALLVAGREDMEAGRINEAIDDFEAALVIHPGSVAVLLELAGARRAHGMQGVALHYYRQALASDPRNLAAIAGEGAALAERGALDKAQRNLARLQGMCGSDCDATRDLASVIESGSTLRVVTAESVGSEPAISEKN